MKKKISENLLGCDAVQWISLERVLSRLMTEISSVLEQCWLETKAIRSSKTANERVNRNTVEKHLI